MLATSNDLAVRLRRDVNVPAAEALIEEASSLIESFTGQDITLVEDDEVTLVGNWTRRLELPKWPVTDVSEVAVDGEALTADTDYTWTRRGVLWRPRTLASSSRGFDLLNGAYWGGDDVEVVVTYSHGLATVPPWVRSICLDVCARAYQSPDGVVREAIDGYSVTYTNTGFNQAGGVNLLDIEERKLRRLKKPAQT